MLEAQVDRDGMEDRKHACQWQSCMRALVTIWRNTTGSSQQHGLPLLEQVCQWTDEKPTKVVDRAKGLCSYADRPNAALFCE